MRRLRPNAGLGLAVLLGLFAVWPFLTRPSLPTNTDADLHIYRTYEIASAWEQGVSYLRWAPDFAFGYGYPIFNYYAPLAHYVAAAYARSLGDAVAGVKFVLVLNAIVGGAGMYALARTWWGEVGGLLSAAAFALAPYVAYINPMARGAAPEALAVALAPGVWWLFVRLEPAPHSRRLVSAALGVAALCLAHNMLSVVFLTLIGAWVVWETFYHRHARTLVWALGAMALGLCLSAFMWGPALLERGAVQIQRAFAVAHDPAAPLRWVDWRELLMPMTFSNVATLPVNTWAFRLGVPQWGLAGLGGLTLIHPTHARRTIFFIFITAVFTLLLITPQAEWLWRHTPLIYLQLPWRLLGPAALLLALLAGASLQWAAPAWQTRMALITIAAIIFSALPLLHPLPWANYGPVTLERLWWFEKQGNLGATAQNEFLPVAVLAMPPPAEALFQAYANGQVDKLNHATLPTGSTSNVLAHNAVRDVFLITLPSAATLTFFTFAFPGWIARVDSIPAVVTPASESGFITVSVPAGSHRVELLFKDTPARQWGWAITLLAGLLSGIGVLRRQPAPPAPLAPARAGTPLVYWGTGALVCVALLSARLERNGGPASLAAPPTSQALAVFDKHIELVNATLSAAATHPGETITLALNWRATGAAPRDLSVFVHLVGSDGKVWGQSDKPRPVAEWPTDRWPSGRVFTDIHTFTIRADAPEGLYTLRAGLWNSLTGERLPVIAPTEADSLVVGTLKLTR